MTEKELVLKAEPRTELGKQNKNLRNQGYLPAVLYGAKKESATLKVPAKDFKKIYKQAGENTLIDLEMEGQNQIKVLIHDVATHYMSPEPIHVDFYEVDLTKKIHASIPLHFEGVSAAVKESGGTLIRTLTEIEVSALPADLPSFIVVDISPLNTLEDIVRIKDLQIPEKVEVVGHDAEDVIASVQAPRSEAELDALEETTSEEAEAEAIKEVAGEENKEEEGGDEKKKEEDKKEE